MFPRKENKHQMINSSKQKYKVNFSKTKRNKKYEIPFMAGLLNKEDNEKMMQEVNSLPSHFFCIQ